MRKIVGLSLFLLPALAGAQLISHPGWVGTTGNLPACNAARDGTVVAITDAPVTPDCSTGSGSTRALCQCTNGTGWGVIQGAGGGSTSLDGLTDTDVGIESSGEILIWDGSDSWDNKAISGDIGLLADGTTAVNDDAVGPDAVESAGQTDEYCLTYEADDDGWDWAACASGATTEIGMESQLTDVVDLVTDNDASVTFDAGFEIVTSSNGDIDLSPNGTGEIDLNAPVNTEASASPTVAFKDSDATAGDDNVTLSAACTDVGDGTEDCDVLIQQQIAGTPTNAISIDADGAGDARLTLPDSSVGPDEIMATSQTDGYYLQYVSAGDTVQWAVGSGGAFSDASDPIVQNTTTKDVHVGDGAGTLAGKVEIGGDADQPQLVVEGHSTQTDSVFVIQADNDTEVFAVEDDGTTTIGTGAGSVTGSAGGVDLVLGASDVATIGDGATTDYWKWDENGVMTPEGAATIELLHSEYWRADDLSSDGTQCADPAEVTINSGPKQYTIICADNDASAIYGSMVMPDSWDAGNLTFELAYIQTAADTAALEWDIYAQCRGATEAVNNTWETAVNVIDAGVTGSNAVDHTTSGNVTCASDAAGDTLFWKIEIDAAGTATAMATLNILGVKMEYLANDAD